MSNKEKQDMLTEYIGKVSHILENNEPLSTIHTSLIVTSISMRTLRQNMIEYINSTEEDKALFMEWLDWAISELPEV